MTLDSQTQALVLQHAKSCLDAVRHIAVRDGFDEACVYGLIDSITPNIAYVANEINLSGERTTDRSWSA